MRPSLGLTTAQPLSRAARRETRVTHSAHITFWARAVFAFTLAGDARAQQPPTSLPSLPQAIPSAATPQNPAGPSALAGPGIEGIGLAPIVSGDRVKARARALDEAFRGAIDSAAATLPGATGAGLADRTAVLKLTIHPKAKSYVTGYRILEEGEQGTMFRVRVAADVAMSRLEHDLSPRAVGSGAGADGRPTAKAQMPKMLFCLAERRALGDASAALQPWTLAPDGELPSAVATPGLDAAGMPGGCLPEGASTDPTDDKASAAMRQSGAQGGLVGTRVVRTEGAIRGTALVAAHATVLLRLVEPDGHLGASVRVERDAWGQGGAAAERAVARAALDEAATMIAPAVARLQSTLSAGPGVLVHLTGVRALADLQLFQRSASAVSGVLSVEPRRFFDAGVDVYVRGDAAASALAAALARGPDAARLLALPDGDRILHVKIVALAPNSNGSSYAPVPSPPNENAPSAGAAPPTSGLPRLPSFPPPGAAP